MRRNRILLWTTVVILFVCLIGGAVAYRLLGRQVNLSGALGGGGVAEVTLPPGFSINVFAEGLNGPRFIAFGPEGHLYVAERGSDRILVLPDHDDNGRADLAQVFADGLNNPHSLAYHQDAWFVGVPTGVVRLQDTNGDGTADTQTILINDIPASGVHRTRTVEFLPDGRMVLSVGSSCNVCEEDDPRRATIVVYDGPQATGERLYATGLRNAVGLAVHPETGDLWATNNGRDLMGDDLPPDTIHIVEEGFDYGWPFCHSDYIVDPDIGFDGACDDVPAPVANLQAHSAPLGLTFYPDDIPGDSGFPLEYQGDLFIAYHGSWNRSVPTGYKIVRLPLDGDELGGQVEDFAVGWLNEDDSTSTGRPVGLAVGPDGALFVSDDKGGVVYRISHTGGS